MLKDDQARGCGQISWSEASRLQALESYGILDTPTEPLFDDIAKLASEVCNTPIAVVNFVGSDRQWFKSEVGIGQRELPLDVSICRYAILQRGLFVVPDLSADARFTNNPLVHAADGLRFYAGALLESPEGLPIGTLCVLDTVARPQGLAEIEGRTLRNLARQVMSELELRRALADRDREVERSKRTEALLRDSETRLQLALRAARAVAWQWDLSTQTVRWADLEAIRELAGDEIEETTSFEDWLRRIHPDDVERHMLEGAAAVEAGHGTVTFRFLKQEQTRWLQAMGRVTSYSPEGQPLVMTGITQDITDRMEAEEALRNNEARLRIAMEAGALGEWEWDASNDVVTFSEQGAAVFGIPAGPVMTWTDLQSMIEPGDAEEAADAVRRAIAERTDYRFEYRLNRPDGQKVWINAVGRPLFNEAGAPLRMVGMVQDITARRRAEAELRDLNQTLEQRVTAEVAERQRAEEALRQSQKLESMGQLTGGVAHDFNNLLTPIIGSLDLLQRRRFGDERVQRLIDGALQSAERAKTLVQRLLAFARRQPLQATSVDLIKSITGMADLIASTVGPRVHLEVDVDHELPPVCADQNQLEMALLNLSVNARDAMPDGGTLRIKARVEQIVGQHRSGLPDGSFVSLSVQDTGSGMDEATRVRAIEPFFSTKGVGRGTGLGLSMVHGLAAQLGGALSIESSPGAGTTIELWLPIANLPAEEKTESAIADQRSSGLAVIVDDEELVRASIASMLQELGFAVIEHKSADEALAELRRGTEPTVVLTDHLMPNMTGTQLAETLADERPSLPVLIISGYADDAGIAPSMPRLTKPFRQSDLAAKLSDMQLA